MGHCTKSRESAEHVAVVSENLGVKICCQKLEQILLFCLFVWWFIFFPPPCEDYDLVNFHLFNYRNCFLFIENPQI